MLVINQEEQDFALCVDYDLPESYSRRVGKFNKLLFLALFISILLHLFIFVLKPGWYSPVSAISQSIEISLQKIEEPKSLPSEIIETEELLIEKPQAVIQSNPDERELKKNSDIPLEIADAPSAQSLKLLSAEDYSAIAQDNSANIHSDTLAFNPNLRQRRSETRRPAASKNTKSLKSWQDTYGNEYYQVGGQCFMSPPQNITSAVKEGKNWYMVSCSGKTESEKMMDNVNQEMKARFSQ